MATVQTPVHVARQARCRPARGLLGPFVALTLLLGWTAAGHVAWAQPVTTVAINRAKLDWQAAQKAGTRSAFERFIQDHAQSGLVRDAEQGIQRIEAQEAYAELTGREASVFDLESYLLKYPASQQSAAAYARARQRWAKDRLAAVDAELAAALSSGTARALESFIERHPTSGKLGQARKALQPLSPNAAYASVRSLLVQDIVKEKRPAKESPLAPPRLELVFFHARTSESKSYIVFKDHEHNYLKWAEHKAVEKLPPSFELLELRGIEPMSTFVVYFSDADVSDLKALEISWWYVLRRFMEMRCDLIKPTPCNSREAYLRPDSYPLEKQARWSTAFMATLQDMTRRRPEFGTQPRYVNLPEPRWEDSDFHARYLEQLCRQVAGAPGVLKPAAVSTLAAIDTPAGNRCLFAAGLALGAAPLPPSR
jgi:hypothetical protein